MRSTLLDSDRERNQDERIIPKLSLVVGSRMITFFTIGARC
jgi:hypothetical protein